jgi:hypothetical protein
MESFIPMDMPDADPAVIELARQAFDYKEK